MILDVGAGAGFALVAYAARFPSARLVGLELDPPSAALARKAVADAGLSDRVVLREEDALLLEDHDAYDLVTCNIVLHETGGPPQWLEVLRRLHRALKPGGVLLVSELPYPDSPAAYREQPVYRMLAGLQLHEALVGCETITQGQLPALLAEAGFTQVRVVDQPLPTRIMLLAARPPN